MVALPTAPSPLAVPVGAVAPAGTPQAHVPGHSPAAGSLCSESVPNPEDSVAA